MIELKLFNDRAEAVERNINSFDINNIPLSVRDRLFKSYEDDYYYSREDFDEMTIYDMLNESTVELENDVLDVNSIVPVKKTIETIKGIIGDIDEKQFLTVSHNGIDSLHIKNAPEFWVQPIYGFIPNNGLNIEIIDKVMRESGYVRTRTTESKERKNGRKWYFVVYNPDTKYLKSVRDVLLYDRFFHYTPEFNKDDIMKTGLIPSCGGRTYTYPDNRVFFYVHTGGKLANSYRTMMRGISRKEKKSHPDFDGTFEFFELDMDKLPSNIKIYYDPNADNCVFVTEHINPEWLIYKERFRVVF